MDRSRQYSYVWDGQVKVVQLCVGWTGKGSTVMCRVDRQRQYSYVWDGQVKVVSYVWDRQAKLCVGWTGKDSRVVCGMDR